MRALWSFALALGLAFTAPAIGSAQSNTEDAANAAAAAILAGDMAAFEAAISTPGLDLDAILNGQITLLHVAAGEGNTAAMQALIDAGASIDALDEANGWTPLMVAVYRGEEAAAQLLLSEGADQDIQGKDKSTARVLARYSGLSSLFGSQPSPQVPFINQNRLNTLLLKAAEAGDLYLVAGLVREGADPNIVNEAGWTPLLYAAFIDHRPLFTQLVRDHGARLKDDQRQLLSLAQAALIGAATGNKPVQNQVSALTFLRAHGVDLEMRFNSDQTNREFAESLALPSDVIDLFRPPRMEGPELAFALKAAMSQQEWMHIQRTLQGFGLYEGAIDGIAGPATKRAVYAYYRVKLDQVEQAGRQLCIQAREAIKGYDVSTLADGYHQIEVGGLHLRLDKYGRGIVEIKHVSDRIDGEGISCAFSYNSVGRVTGYLQGYEYVIPANPCDGKTIRSVDSSTPFFEYVKCGDFYSGPSASGLEVWGKFR